MPENETSEEITCWADAGDWNTTEAMRLSPLLPRMEAIRLAIRERLAYFELSTESVDTPVTPLSSIYDTIQTLTNAFNSIPFSKFVILKQNNRIDMNLYDNEHNYRIENCSLTSGIYPLGDSGSSLIWQNHTLRLDIPGVTFSTNRVYDQISFSGARMSQLTAPAKLSSIADWLSLMFSSLNRLVLPFRMFRVMLRFADSNRAELQRWILRSRSTSSCSYSYTTESGSTTVPCTRTELDAMTAQQIWTRSVTTRTRSYSSSCFGDCAAFLYQRNSEGTSETLRNIRIAADYKIQVTKEIYDSNTSLVSSAAFLQLPVTIQVSRKYGKADGCEVFLSEGHSEGDEEIILPETNLLENEVKTFCRIPDTCPAPNASATSCGWQTSLHTLTMSFSVPQNILCPFAFR